jgi:hypothetical protein
MTSALSEDGSHYHVRKLLEKNTFTWDRTRLSINAYDTIQCK